MKKYRKKPVVVEAMQFRLGVTKRSEILAFCPNANVGAPFDIHTGETDDLDIRWVAIDTLEGVMEARDGDWIIKGVKGEFYPCKPDVFEASYEAVD